jgi:hypothetical protein
VENRLQLDEFKAKMIEHLVGLVTTLTEYLPATSDDINYASEPSYDTDIFAWNILSTENKAQLIIGTCTGYGSRSSFESLLLASFVWSYERIPQCWQKTLMKLLPYQLLIFARKHSPLTLIYEKQT